MGNKSFFRKLFEDEEFEDRKIKNKEPGVDVIIPIFNTNELFEKNLISIYRAIPVNNLIIGNGGCTDNSLEILKNFPRVKIIDQTSYNTLGYCISELISLVETKWFIYLHADVYLPNDWYDKMSKYKNDYDWYESNSHPTILIEYDRNLKNIKRAYSGAQMGRKSSFKKIIPNIEDDYLYRNEDIVFHELILSENYRYGRVFDTYHYHEVMNKQGKKEPKLEKVLIKKASDKEWEIDTHIKQVKGIIKYLKPKPYLIKAVNKPLEILIKYDAIDIKEFKKWVVKTNKIWLNYILRQRSGFQKIVIKLNNLIKKLYNKFFYKF